MAKWKCEICNSEFDNFQAQGFNHKIYCPLCYFKKLNNDKDKEITRLNKIIEEALYYLEIDMIGTAIDKLKELKEEDKNNEK